ncbi:MAG: S8 family serine peptidase [Nitrosomonas sp.]|nr:S8 family serine peptidase [Nitrosomonas sp.]
MLDSARSKGVVRVMVTLDDTVSIEKMSDLDSIKPSLEIKAQQLLDVLGNDVFSYPVWNNRVGQIGVYVNENGLEKLKMSEKAISIQPDRTHLFRIRVFDEDGSVDKVEDSLSQNGFAEVELILNIEGIEYDLDQGNDTITRDQARLGELVAEKLQKLQNQPVGHELTNISIDSALPKAHAHIDRRTFYALLESEEVRAIRPVGFQDTRKAQWPEEVLEEAKEYGDAEILISLRGGELYTSKTGYMAESAVRAQAEAHQRTFEDILAAIGSPRVEASASTSAELGYFNAKLNYNELAQLYTYADPRILSVELNKVVARTTLTNSTSALNMASAWGAGYRAAGQYIVVIDNGVRKTHAMFNPGGVSKISHEACYGTDHTPSGLMSICPNKDSNGDSPFNQLNASMYLTNTTVCNALQSAGIDNCSHGSHVAGIALGHQSPNISPSNLQGIAPDAFLIPVQVFSYKQTTPYNAGVFNVDILAALNAANGAITSGINPFTINISLGGFGLVSNSAHASCTYYASTVANLISKGVPVVAATGNDGSKTQIDSPACAAGIIKVSSVSNDTSATTLSLFANIASQSSFSGPFLLAPGGQTNSSGGVVNSVTSAHRTSNTATTALPGTSMAAPHVAGFYALVKSASPTSSVADVTAWIMSTGSIPVTISLPGGNQTFRRIHSPAF